MQEKKYIFFFFMSNFSWDFNRGQQLRSETFTKKEESGENLYIKREFKGFLLISDTISLL